MVSTASSCEARLSRTPRPKRNTIQVSLPWRRAWVRGSKAMSTPVPRRSPRRHQAGESAAPDSRTFGARSRHAHRNDAKIIVMAGDADLAGDIAEAGDADGGVDDDAAEGVEQPCRRRPAARHWPAHDQQFGLVRALWMPSRTGSGDRVAIAAGNRARHDMIQADVEIEDVAVGLFPGIVLGKRFRAGRAAATQGQSQGQGRQYLRRDHFMPHQI